MEYIDKIVVENMILDESRKHGNFEFIYKQIYDEVEKMKIYDVIPIDLLIEQRDQFEEHVKQSNSKIYSEWVRGVNAILTLWEVEDKKKWKVYKKRK